MAFPQPSHHAPATNNCSPATTPRTTTMATTMKDLFDDDSSDDEDFSPAVEKKDADNADESAAPNNNDNNSAMASPSGGGPRRVIQEEDDSSADEVTQPTTSTGTNEKEATSETEKPAAATTSKEGETPAQEANTAGTNDTPKPSTEENDEEDVEFDDDGIVGSSAPARSAEAAESTEDAEETPSNRPAKKPRHIQVLESDRPPPGTSLHITKLPNLVGIQTEPFDPDNYSASLEEQDFHVSVHSMIRWRYAKDDQGEFKRDHDGNLIRESNARLVAWDDGNGGPKSYTLHVGNEVFEVDANDSSSNGFAGLNGYLYLSQKATLADEDHTPAGTVLESMGAIQSRLVARPSSLQSEAHKKLTVAVRQKTIKKARIAEYVTQEDPEKAKQDRIKVKQDLEKASARKRQSSGYRRPAMSRRYLEEEDDANYDSVNIRDMKRRARDYDDDEDMDYGEDSEEEDEDDSMFNRRRPKRGSSKAQENQVDEDEEDELVFEDDSDEDDVQIKATSRKKLQHQALVDDDDDE